MGQFSPETVEDENGITVYTFAPDDDGPTCLYGDPFRVTVRDTDSKDLMIYLQGGGACWSQKCAANKTAGAGIQPIGWTNADPDFNPVFFDYDVVFVAYCDGSVFSGDNVVKKPDGSIERRHRGLANLSAALDIALERFPDPERIVLVPPSINKTFWVESERVSAEYLQQMAYFLMQLTLDVTPHSVDHQSGVLMQYAAPASYGELRATMAATAERLKRDGA